MALYRQARYHEVLQKFQEALVCTRDTDDRQGEGQSLNNIGLIYASLGEYVVALDYFQQALTLRREIGDRAGG